MKIYFIFPLLLFIHAESYAQQEPGSTRPKSIEQVMQEKIRLLKNGALLVRLQTKENSITALKNAGNHELADQVESKQARLNKDLIWAFRRNYEFSEVYFFQSQYSEKLLNDQIDEVVFVNDSLQPDPNIKCTKKDFLTAEISNLEPDTSGYFESNYYGYDGAKKSYYGTSNVDFEVLKIMNSHFAQLRDPFPFYVRTYDADLTAEKLSKIITKMNKKLEDYYEKNKVK